VSEFIFGKYGIHRVDREPDRIWISSSYRVVLIKKGIEKAGSINRLGRELGYRSKVHPGWSIRQILLGHQAFPKDRLKMLANFLNTPLEDIMAHQARRGAVTIEGTKDALIKAGLGCYIPR
jgi:hypothetical protein